MSRPSTGLMICLSQGTMDGLAARSLEDGVPVFTTANSIRLSGGWWLIEVDMDVITQLQALDRDPDVAVRKLLDEKGA
jgi:hypothetical protein